MNSLPKVFLKKGKERSLKNFHPWVFSGAIGSKDSEIQPGSPVGVYSFDSEFLGLGFWEGDNSLQIRMFSFQEIESFSDFWDLRWKKAFGKRIDCFQGKPTTAYRLLHAEGDGFPGLVADRYNQTVCLQMGSQHWIGQKKEIISKLKTIGIQNVLHKKEDGSIEIWDGKLQEEWIQENGFRFLVRFPGGQKTGFFLDQRDNRQLLKAYSQNRTVLNLFGYSGGFSVYARGGGALSVTTVDSSSQAIGLAEQNFNENFPSDGKGIHTGIVADVFSFWKESQQHFYDLIVLDPPAFAKHSSSVEQASRGYKEINRKAMERLSSGSLLFSFSCSQHVSMDLFRKILFAAAKDARKDFRVLHTLGAPFDHGFSLFHPEGEYLKGFVLEAMA